MAKKRLVLPVSLCLVLVLCALSVLVACANPTTAPVPAPTTQAPLPKTTAPTTAAAPTSTAATAAKPIVLKWGTWLPTGKSPMTLSLMWWNAEVTKRSNGRIQFQEYWNGALAAGPDLLDALDSGMADVASLLPSYFPGKLPLANIGGLALFMTDSIFAAQSGYRDLCMQSKPMQDELAKFHARFVGPIGSGPDNIITTREVKSVDDLKGLKLRSIGSQAALVQALGAVPVAAQTSELYEGLQKGTFNGSVSSPAFSLTYKLHEVAKFYFQLPMGSQGAYLTGMREATWNSLPADLQKIFMDVSADTPKAYHQIYVIEGYATGFDTMKAAGVKIAQPSQADLDKAKQATKTAVLDKWAAENEAKGLPAKALMNDLATLIAKYEAVDPFKTK